MARFPTFERNFSDLKKLTLADLKRLGLLVPKHRATSTIRWTRRGETTGTIGVAVSLSGTGGYVELEYTYNNQDQINYRINLVQQPSNLGKGQVWYFICPLTGERCRALYQVGKYFASRKAQPRTLYESQTYSKHYRWLDKVYGPMFKAEKAYEELYKPYAKKHYRDKLTPKARKVMKWERAAALGENRKIDF
ncbi:hypothetical protein [Spirosoma panaciterrae]|uniref:hypothetical protein n=1 Tax=Spirosoma panaciterrae TaxID=496058 RepID=UPI00035CC236|nr:hypothetical protein [Spirosoma panaciterrae]